MNDMYVKVNKSAYKVDQEGYDLLLKYYQDDIEIISKIQFIANRFPKEAARILLFPLWLIFYFLALPMVAFTTWYEDFLSRR